MPFGGFAGIMKTATEKLIEQVESLVDSGEIGSGKIATMKALAKQARLDSRALCDPHSRRGGGQMTSAHLWLGPVPAVLAAGQPTPGFSVPARVLSIENFDRAERGLAAMHRFCDRVEAGEVRSKRTYAEFCEILGREPRK